MLRARLSNGNWIIGIDADNVRELQKGRPMKIDLADGQSVLLMYGETLQEIMDEIEQASGQKLPPAKPLPGDAVPL